MKIITFFFLFSKTFKKFETCKTNYSFITKEDFYLIYVFSFLKYFLFLVIFENKNEYSKIIEKKKMKRYTTMDQSSFYLRKHKITNNFILCVIFWIEIESINNCYLYMIWNTHSI